MIPEIIPSVTALGWPSAAIIGMVLCYRLAGMILAVMAGYRFKHEKSGFTFEPCSMPKTDLSPTLAVRARLKALAKSGDE